MLSETDFLIMYHKAKPEKRQAINEMLYGTATPERLRELLTACGEEPELITKVVNAYTAN